MARSTYRIAMGNSGEPRRHAMTSWSRRISSGGTPTGRIEVNLFRKLPRSTSCRRIPPMLCPARVSVTAAVMVAIVALNLQLGGTSSKAGATDAVRSAPDACRLLSATEASQLLRLSASSRAFTDLGFPVSRTTARNPTYSQCRFTPKSSPSQIRLIINTSLAKAPPLRIRAITARTEPGGRILTIERELAVWLPWMQEDLRGQGGSLTSVKDGDYVAVSVLYVRRDPLRAAEDAMRMVLSRISTSR